MIVMHFNFVSICRDTLLFYPLLIPKHTNSTPVIKIVPRIIHLTTPHDAL